MRIKKVKVPKRNQNVFYKLCTKMNDVWNIFMNIFYLPKYLFLWNLFKNLLKESLLFYYTLKKNYSYIPSDNLCLILFWLSVESIICIISHCYRLIKLHNFNQFYQYLFKDFGHLFSIEVMFYHSCLSLR